MNYSVDYHQKAKYDRCKNVHFHNNTIEITQVVSGKGILISDNLEIPFEAGDMLFIDGRTLHGVFPENPDEYVRNRLSIDRGAVLELSEKGVIESNACVKCETERFDFIDLIYRQIFDNIKIPSMKFFVMSNIFNLLHICVDMMIETGVKKSVASNVREYIHSNLNRNITIDDISESIHMSKYYICRRFKEETGMTVMNYVKQAKSNKARQFLAYSNKSITEIAEECGFSDVATFSKTFKQFMGYSPSVCRKRLMAMGENKK